MTAPVLAVGDGARVLEGAARGVPRHDRARCWWHKIGNVLAALPKSAHPGAKAALAEIYNAADRDHAVKAANAFVGRWMKTERSPDQTRSVAFTDALKAPSRSGTASTSMPTGVAGDSSSLRLVRTSHTIGASTIRRRHG